MKGPSVFVCLLSIFTLSCAINVAREVPRLSASFSKKVETEFRSTKNEFEKKVNEIYGSGGPLAVASKSFENATQEFKYGSQVCEVNIKQLIRQRAMLRDSLNSALSLHKMSSATASETEGTLGLNAKLLADLAIVTKNLNVDEDLNAQQASSRYNHLTVGLKTLKEAESLMTDAMAPSNSAFLDEIFHSRSLQMAQNVFLELRAGHRPIDTVEAAVATTKQRLADLSAYDKAVDLAKSELTIGDFGNGDASIFSKWIQKGAFGDVVKDSDTRKRIASRVAKLSQTSAVEYLKDALSRKHQTVQAALAVEEATKIKKEAEARRDIHLEARAKVFAGALGLVMEARKYVKQQLDALPVAQVATEVGFTRMRKNVTALTDDAVSRVTKTMNEYGSEVLDATAGLKSNLAKLQREIAGSSLSLGQLQKDCVKRVDQLRVDMFKSSAELARLEKEQRNMETEASVLESKLSYHRAKMAMLKRNETFLVNTQRIAKAGGEAIARLAVVIPPADPKKEEVAATDARLQDALQLSLQTAAFAKRAVARSQIAIAQTEQDRNRANSNALKARSDAAIALGISETLHVSLSAAEEKLVNVTNVFLFANHTQYISLRDELVACEPFKLAANDTESPSDQPVLPSAACMDARATAADARYNVGVARETMLKSTKLRDEIAGQTEIADEHLRIARLTNKTADTILAHATRKAGALAEALVLRRAGERRTIDFSRYMCGIVSEMELLQIDSPCCTVFTCDKHPVSGKLRVRGTGSVLSPQAASKAKAML